MSRRFGAALLHAAALTLGAAAAAAPPSPGAPATQASAVAPPPHPTAAPRARAPSRDLGQVQVALRAFVAIEPRQEAFHFDVLLEALNVGTTTWLADDTFLDLPEGAQAFTPTEGASFNCVLVGDRRIRLSGSVPPGRRDASFTFQVPARGRTGQRFQFSLPPRVAQLRVLAEAGPRMHLNVAGFPPPARVRAEQGQPLLVTEKTAAPEDPPLSSLSIELSGLPAPSSGRYLALLFVLALVAGGVVLAARQPGRGRHTGRSGRASGELVRARDLVLDECVFLHQARQDGKIGPGAYETARRSLLDAVARLELLRISSRTSARKPSPSQEASPSGR